MHARTLSRAVPTLLAAVVSFGLLLTPATGQDHQRAQVPGEVDGRVTQATIRSTICTRGYTAKVRPPRKVTDAIKRRLAQGIPGRSRTSGSSHGRKPRPRTGTSCGCIGTSARAA